MTERPIEASGATPRPDEPVAAPLSGDAVPTAPAGGAPPPTAPRRGTPKAIFLGAIFLGAILAAILFAGGIATSPWWAPEIAPLLPWAASQMVETDPRLDALEQRLAGAERLLAQLGQRAGQDEASAGLAPLRQSVERQAGDLQALGNRIAAIEKQPAQPAADPAALRELQVTVGGLGGALAELDAKVSKLAGAGTGGSRTDQALLLSLGQLRQTLQGSGPFAAELAAATTLAQDRDDVRAALAPLSEPASRGLPSLAVLRQRFDGLAGSIADAATSPTAATEWSDKILAKLRALVSVRRIGPGASGNGPEAAVAIAEGALAADDLAGAVAALETLHGPAMLAAREWLETARSRLAAEAALDKATALVTVRLAADQSPAAPGGSGAKP